MRKIKPLCGLTEYFFHCHNISAKLAISSSSLAVSKIILKRALSATYISRFLWLKQNYISDLDDAM